jgi:hypothetical protein
MNRDLFATVALAQIPKILTLLDRNPHSPTYGCFDRNFWQYKIIDFPSGMSQEFVYPLALAYHTNLEINAFYQQQVLKDWVEAGINYASISSHSDGSCDDYFPFERAGGAAAFSLLACLESYQLMQLKNSQFLDFFAKRANWLAHHHESGQLTNHQALIVLCLERLSQMLNTSQWDKQKSLRLERVIDWQNEEGWFQEYEGCDPGYHTLTIYCLSQIYQIRPDPRLKEVLEKAVKLASYFIHPDGSYGGEYASRNTYNFFPAGFEFVGTWLPEALTINEQFLKGISQGLEPCYADDHIIGHHTWNYLLAWQHFCEKRPHLPTRQSERIYLKNAQILIDRRDNYELYLALNKGGVFKLFYQGHLMTSDTQFSLKVKNGKKIKNAVAHLIDNYATKVEDNRLIIMGELGWAKQKQMTPLNLLILRLVMLTVGRFFPNLIRKLLQKMLITGKQKAPFQFTRELTWEQGQWKIEDTLKAVSWNDVVEGGIGCDQTSIYVVMSRTFQLGQLQPWLNLTAQIQTLRNDQALTLKRTF